MWFSQGNLQNRTVNTLVEGCRQQKIVDREESTKQVVKLVWALHTCHLLRLALCSIQLKFNLNCSSSKQRTVHLTKPKNYLITDNIRGYFYNTFLMKLKTGGNQANNS